MAKLSPVWWQPYQTGSGCHHQIKLNQRLVRSKVDLFLLCFYFHLGGVRSFLNKEKLVPEVTTPTQAPAPACHNWLQSGCPLNNNMVIHHCDSSSAEDVGKQDQIRGMALQHCGKDMSYLLSGTTCSCWDQFRLARLSHGLEGQNPTSRSHRVFQEEARPQNCWSHCKKVE